MMPSPPQVNGGYTLRIAASNSSAQNKQGADYICTGTNDDGPIQAAINALPATGGKVIYAQFEDTMCLIDCSLGTSLAAYPTKR